MKRILGLALAGLMTLGLGSQAAADTSAVAVPTSISTEPTMTIMPVVISAKVVDYTIEQEDNQTFTVVVSENASTGYTWNYRINDEALVELVSDETIAADTELVGAPSEKRMTFKVLGNGVSTVLFKNMQNFGDYEVSDVFTLLVYKTDDQLIVEEDQMVYAQDTVGIMPISEMLLNTVASYNGEDIAADVDVQVVDGKVMVPLRAVAEALGYTVTWNNETRSVEISQGAQWTSIAIGENAYFRNRMASHELSSAPVIVDNRTLVPVEFFADILGRYISVENKKLNFTDMESIVHSGYVKSISYDETGMKTLTLTSDYESDNFELQVIIHTADAYSFYQKEVSEGDYVNVASSMIMTMSMPGQTSGYIVY